MKTELKNKLDSHYLNIENIGKEKKAKRDEVQKKQAVETEQFYKIRTNIIIPAFNEIKKYLAERGQTSSVEHKDEILDPHGNSTQKPSVTIFLYDRTDLGGGKPCFEISFDKYADKVLFSARSGCFSGGRGQYLLKQITHDLIQDEFAKYLIDPLKNYR